MLILDPTPYTLEEQETILINWLGPNVFNRFYFDEEVDLNAAKYNLTLPELIILRFWTDEGYEQINQYLHKKNHLFSLERIDSIKKGIKLLRQALDKLPNYTQTVVISRQDFPQDFINRFMREGIMTCDGFLAANIGVDFDSLGCQRLVINSKTGKHINWISEFKDSENENEVLFKNSTSFNLLAWEYDEDSGDTLYYFQEVEREVMR